MGTREGFRMESPRAELTTPAREHEAVWFALGAAGLLLMLTVILPGAVVGAAARATTFIATAATARWRAVTMGPLVAFGALMACAWCMLTGHPATHGPSGLVHAMTFLHMGAGAVWFGGLIALALVMRHRRRDGDLGGGAAVVARFSRLMGWAIAALLTGGAGIGRAVRGGLGAPAPAAVGLVVPAKASLGITAL